MRLKLLSQIHAEYAAAIAIVASTTRQRARVSVVPRAGAAAEDMTWTFRAGARTAVLGERQKRSSTGSCRSQAPYTYTDLAALRNPCTTVGALAGLQP